MVCDFCPNKTNTNKKTKHQPRAHSGEKPHHSSRCELGAHWAGSGVSETVPSARAPPPWELGSLVRLCR